MKKDVDESGKRWYYNWADSEEFAKVGNSKSTQEEQWLLWVFRNISFK